MLPELIKVIKSKIATIKNYPGQFGGGQRTWLA